MCADPGARSVTGMQLAIDMPGWVEFLLGLPKWVVMAKWTVIATLLVLAAASALQKRKHAGGGET